MTDRLAPLKLVISPDTVDENTAGGIETRSITINSVSFWRDEKGTLFLRGWDEDLNRTVDISAPHIRFAG